MKLAQAVASRLYDQGIAELGLAERDDVIGLWSALTFT
jgi:hypothetical protein